MTDFIYLIGFYVFAALALVGGCFAVFAKKTLTSVIAVAVTFWAFSGLYFLLKLYPLAIVQLLVFGVAGVFLFSFCAAFTTYKQEDKTRFKLDFRSVMTVVLLVLLGLLLLPFVQEGLAARSSAFIANLSPLWVEFFAARNDALSALEILLALVFSAIVGFRAYLPKVKPKKKESEGTNVS